jgi:Tropinone reductase 1
MNSWNLSAKRALVTGGSKGIGLAAACEMAALGAELGIVARHPEEIEEALVRIGQAGGSAWGVCADVATEEGRAALAEAVFSRWDSLHVLVNNVGMNIRKGFADYEEEEYRRIFETNLFSAMALSRLLLPLLRTSGKGSIINVASVAGTVDVRSGAPYGMTKAALVQMTRHLAVEWAPLGIRVNAVSPWYTRTPLAQPVLQQPERMALILAATPLGRIAEAEEVGAAIAFLAMDKASYISGHDLVVDGAFLARGL